MQPSPLAFKMVHRAVVTGATHVLGRAVIRLFKSDPSWQIHGVDVTTPPAPNVFDVRQCDLADESAVKELIQQLKPDVLIHA